MANKKAASSTKKTTVKSSSSTKKPTTTKVTTVKAVESRPTERAATAGRSSFVGRLDRTPLLGAAIAEFVGTFMLTAVIVTQQNQPIAVLFALVGIVLIVGGLSGAHVNPAMTIGAWVTRKIESSRAVAYLVAQVLGAMLALVVLNAFVGQAGEVSEQAAMMGQTAPELFKAAPIPEGKEWVLLFAELLGAAVLGFAYASALRAGRDKIVSAFTIGAGFFTALVIGGTAATYVNASAILNPAAAISLQAITFDGMWPIAIYVVTTALGAVIGFALFDLVRNAEDKA